MSGGHETGHGGDHGHEGGHEKDDHGHGGSHETGHNDHGHGHEGNHDHAEGHGNHNRGHEGHEKDDHGHDKHGDHDEHGPSFIGRLIKWGAIFAVVVGGITAVIYGDCSSSTPSDKRYDKIEDKHRNLEGYKPPKPPIPKKKK